MYVLIICTCKCKSYRTKQPRKGGDIVFPNISQWGLSVAMETRVLIRSALNLRQPYPYPKDVSDIF